MNGKFFDVKVEKQERIINAALMVFALNGYRKASTDVIVKEAGISKGLLFHYFNSKIGLYEFVSDYSVRYMNMEMTSSVSARETDFFEIQREIELIKTRIMKKYPYMQQFLSTIKYEREPEAVKVSSKYRNALSDLYRSLYQRADISRFHDYVNPDIVIRSIEWMSDGFIRESFLDENPDIEEMSREFGRYLAMMRAALYRGGSVGVTREDFS